MERFEAPRADFAVLVFLVCATVIAGCVGATLYWLTLPTVIPNASFAEPKRTSVSYLHELAAVSPVPDMERAARDVAQEENAELGLDALTAFAAATPTAVATPEPKIREVKERPKPAKPKRVVHVQKRAPVEPWQNWGFAQQRPFGGGFWFQ